MLSSEIYYKVTNINNESVISINGFNYTKVDVLLPGDIPMIIYVGEKQINYIKANEYFYTKRAYLTSSYIKGDKSGSFSFRIDFVEESSKEDFDEQKGVTTVNFNGRLNKRKEGNIKYFGPMAIATYDTRASLKNELGEIFNVLLVGFHGKAKMLNNLPSICYVDIKGNISAPKKSDKPCAIVLKDFILRKEVTTDEKIV